MNLDLIDRESRTLAEYAKRAEAWASTQAKPPTVREMAIVGARTHNRQEFRNLKSMRVRIALVEQEIAKARTKRENNRTALWNKLSDNINKDA